MEQPLLHGMKTAWDSAPSLPESQALALLTSGDSGPWPLPFYPVLGEAPRDSDDHRGELLASPCWRLHWKYLQEGVLPTARSTLPLSPAQPTPAPQPGAQRMPDARLPRDPAHRRCSRFPGQAVPPGLPTAARDTSASRRPWHRGGRPLPSRRSRRLRSACLEWIRRALNYLACGGYPGIVGAQGS
ncbi:annexin-2 receptor-like [Talpa occidentalis]|uniref:annexin-2 receptor-like n=1 Tax=Talpa occidentalis TaxID=50954 RepID=UPI001890298F|nr:annexin-2 receptor-like [Talpa occidentalis]